MGEENYMKVRKDFKVTNWSGGKTTELMIYPENKDYINRDFDFRISSATVELEESTFTKLEYNRILLILEGELDLLIEGKVLHLKELEQHSFDGSKDITSKGMVTDFNLMYTDDYTCSVDVLHMDGEKEITMDDEFYYLYLYKGNVTINDIAVNEKEMVELHENSIIKGSGIIILSKIKRS